MKKPILFLIFNRLETTKKVLDAIRKVKPLKLYIASDGPRSTVLNEKISVEQVRKYVLKNIDWNCQVKTLFREENLGCGRAVSGAISWFFNQEADGIILEDDCLPNKDFFRYCENLLDYYRDNKKVMHITGDQFYPDMQIKESYYFASIMHCWGWASWADRWEKYDFKLKSYSTKDLKSSLKDKGVFKYWANIFNKIQKKEIDTWDYQWALAIIANNGYCINPAKNLVSNIGFGIGGTHTQDAGSTQANLNTHSIWPIIHPKSIELNKRAVEYIYKEHFGIELEGRKLANMYNIILNKLIKLKESYEN